MYIPCHLKQLSFQENVGTEAQQFSIYESCNQAAAGRMGVQDTDVGGQVTGGSGQSTRHERGALRHAVLQVGE